MLKHSKRIPERTSNMFAVRVSHRLLLLILRGGIELLRACWLRPPRALRLCLHTRARPASTRKIRFRKARSGLDILSFQSCLSKNTLYGTAAEIVVAPSRHGEHAAAQRMLVLHMTSFVR